ncbi:Hydroxyacylglutathione hydrolase GloC [Thermoflexales bacterium]|nr:Hydroxyacylglutathione hydrolase GloC [Thermoflexales bacterium]
MIVQTLVLGPAQTNCYLAWVESSREGVVREAVAREAVVIDPAWEADAILAAARSAELTIAAILLTHGHFDHIGAAADLKEALGVPLIAHARELDLLRLDGGAKLFGLEIRSVPRPDRLVAHGEQIAIGPLQFEVRHVPGHTTGHLAFVEQTQRTVFVGDVLFAGSIGRTDLPGGNYDTLISSLTDHLLTLPDDFKVYPGHGPPTTIGRERNTNPFL